MLDIKGYGFTVVLLVAGVTLYVAKKGIAERRKAELDQYRACKLQLLYGIFGFWTAGGPTPQATRLLCNFSG